MASKVGKQDGREPSAVAVKAGDKPPAKAPRRLFASTSWKLKAIVASLMLATIAGSLVLSAALIYYTIRFPDPMALRTSTSMPTVRVLARDGSVLTERGQASEFMPLDLLPRHVIDAVVAVEDRRFFEHKGLDPAGLARAFFANLRAGRYVQGGSTLSQQLAKNLFLTSERTMVRKLEELLLAIWLEIRLPKQDILELYLNRVYFGGGAYGIETASRRYFDKPARQLTLAEAAVLAGLLKAPSKFSPLSSPGLARTRARVVLAAMRDAGFIGPEAEAAATRQSVRFADPSQGRAPTGLEYAVEFVLERLPPLIGTGHSEIVVETTIDKDIQKRAQAAVENALATEGAAAGATQAAVVVLDTDGAIRALVGGRSFAASQFNRAVKSKRQPGSAFKPFVYLAAVEQGSTPETIVLDLPLNIGGWAPRNENGQHKGAMSLRQALANSVNTVAVRLQQDVGTARVISTARRLGVKSDLRSDPSLALGTSEVSLLELTGAYGVLANGGLGLEPHAIRSVRSGPHSTLYQRPGARPRMVVAPDHVGIMSSMLTTAMVSGTGRRALLARHTAAGKTGTTQDFRDAWFVGYTAHLTAGVWVGNDGGEPMNRVMGGGLPAAIWKTVMQAAHERLPPSALPGLETKQPWAADTLRDSDRAAQPGGTISDLMTLEAVAAPPARAPTSIRSIRRTPGAAAARSASQAATATLPAAATGARKAPAPLPRLPSQSISPDLFARALEPETSPQPRSFASPGLDLDGVRRALDLPAQPERMGLGAMPQPGSPNPP